MRTKLGDSHIAPERIPNGRHDLDAIRRIISAMLNLRKETIELDEIKNKKETEVSDIIGDKLVERIRRKIRRNPRRSNK